jgi:hypothetical protein
MDALPLIQVSEVIYKSCRAESDPISGDKLFHRVTCCWEYCKRANHWSITKFERMALQLTRQDGVVKQEKLFIEHNKCKQQLQRIDGSEQAG